MFAILWHSVVRNSNNQYQNNDVYLRSLCGLSVIAMQRQCDLYVRLWNVLDCNRRHRHHFICTFGHAVHFVHTYRPNQPSTIKLIIQALSSFVHAVLLPNCYKRGLRKIREMHVKMSATWAFTKL